MKKVFINYADKGFYNSQQKGLKAALQFGFDEAIGYGPLDLDPEFRQSAAHILQQPRGAGYWLWKPYIIKKTLETLQEGDILAYMDSGATFCKNPSDLFDQIGATGIMAFDMVHLQSAWCKGDCFEAVVGADRKSYEGLRQMTAAFSFYRKCKDSVDFVDEWLRCSMIPNAIDDSPSISPNCPDFREHRHDQAIFTLLVYKHGATVLPDISQWCVERGIDPSLRYVDHHRERW